MKEKNSLISGPKIICLIKPKNLAKKNIFDYETFFKISKNNKFLTLISNEKFSKQ